MGSDRGRVPVELLVVGGMGAGATDERRRQRREFGLGYERGEGLACGGRGMELEVRL